MPFSTPFKEYPIIERLTSRLLFFAVSLQSRQAETGQTFQEKMPIVTQRGTMLRPCTKERAWTVHPLSCRVVTEEGSDSVQMIEAVF